MIDSSVPSNSHLYSLTRSNGAVRLLATHILQTIDTNIQFHLHSQEVEAESCVILSASVWHRALDLLKLLSCYYLITCVSPARSQPVISIQTHRLLILFTLIGQHPVCERWFASIHPDANDLPSQSHNAYCNCLLMSNSPPPTFWSLNKAMINTTTGKAHNLWFACFEILEIQKLSQLKKIRRGK